MKNDYKEYLKSEHWKSLRLKIRKNNSGICSVCGSKNNINIHHKTYKNLGNENLKDLELLCRRCHRATHSIGLKKKHQIKFRIKKELKDWIMSIPNTKSGLRKKEKIRVMFSLPKDLIG